MNSRKSEHGQALIVIVFAILGLFGITALAVDGGRTFAETRRAQTAADSAALAAALARIRGNDWVDVTFAAANQNGFDNNGESNFVQVHSPPVTGVYEGNIEYIQVIITSHVSTTFARVIGIERTTTVVEAVSRTKTPVITQILNGNAVISLAPTSDCDNHKSFWIHAEATLDISNAGVFVNSDNEDCALIQQGNGSIRIDGDDTVSIVGGIDIQKPQLFTPYPLNTGAVQISYPPPFMMPQVNCREEAMVLEDGVTMSAGAWGEDFPPQGVHNLEAGIYCIDVGDFIVNSGYELNGNNVVFVVERGLVRWSSGANVHLGAPLNGKFAGLLLYLPMENHSRVALNAGEDSSVRGTILAPGADLRINGNDSENGFHSQIIGYRVEVDGDSNIVIRYDDEQNYDALTMPEIELIE